ncbi:hypothetical protein INT48_002049 [Thamnidium elegans]|uniref:Cyclin-like domain-containing protein n=1 Tax=Thamnidium elegans TaxID=101142 RepID=A0A8H7SV70_9FUNG|nr:hypothetical protein INT48_002049 [Thamnidium elegans]
MNPPNQDAHLYVQSHVMHNARQLQYIRSCFAAIAGSAAGILGLTNLSGFLFYALSWTILSTLLIARTSRLNKYFIQGYKDILFDGALGGLLSYILFHTLLYENKRCTDPNLYSLKNLPNYHQLENNMIYLPPLLNEKQATVDTKDSSIRDQDKSVMINKLIEAAADIIDSIHSKRNTRAMSTSSFISEILKRSRATYSMLQLALFYMFRIKKSNPFVNCSRRIFLAALMVASKYLNDKNYKNKAWAKITCLSVTEINTTEMEFLKLIEYQLYVSKPLYDKWVSLLQEHIKKKNTVRPVVNHSPPIIQLPSPTNTFDIPSPVSDVVNTPPLVYGSKRSRSPSLVYENAAKHLRKL